MKKNKLFRLLAIIFLFSSGFMTHAFFFPDFLPQEMAQTSKKIAGIAPDKKEQNDPLIRKVKYADGKFSPDTIIIRYGSYVAIINESKTELMWLESDNKYLNTPRGYGEGEEQRVRMDTEGTFNVVNKLDIEATLKVIVKK